MWLGVREFSWRLSGLSSESRFMQAYRDGDSPEPSVEDSIAALDY